MSTQTHARTSKDTSSMAMRVKEVMTPHPCTIGHDQTLSVAHQMMRDHRVRHLPVLDAGKLVGLVSQRDLYFLETIAGVDLESDRVEDAMSPDVFTVSPTETVENVAKAMAERHLGCALVVDHERVIGIFTATDALRLVAGGRPHPKKRPS